MDNSNKTTKSLFKAREDYLSGVSFKKLVNDLDIHYIPRQSLRKQFIKEMMVMTAPHIAGSWVPIQEKIEELNKECFLSTATKWNSLVNIAKSVGYKGTTND